ncbi:MAG: hypothetical protein ACI3VQ_05135 [Faecousia sp.]
MKKLLALLLSLALTCVLFCGCGGDSTDNLDHQGNDSYSEKDSSGDLTGRWECEGNDSYTTKDGYRYLPASLELFSNGSGSANIPYYRRTDSISWTSDGGRLKIDCGISYSFTYDYEIDGSELILTYEEHSVTLIKQ